MRKFGLILSAVLFGMLPALSRDKFVHPGVLNTAQDIAVIKKSVIEGDSLAVASYNLLKSNPAASYSYEMQGPFEKIARDGEYRHTKRPMEEDFGAAYLNTLMWVCTGDERHAEKAAEILTAYADTLKEIPESNDTPLLAGIEGFQIAYSAEILAHTYPCMGNERNEKVKKMLTGVFLPVIDKFFNTLPYTNGNWGAIINKTNMAIAIYIDDYARYDRALSFYTDGWDNGTLKHYISGKTGQIQESGRDQVHSMMGVGALAATCEIAWKQGDDLYSALDNRLFKGFEYLASYNLGNEVPFETWTDVTGKYSGWEKVSEQGRFRSIPIFFLPYNHYVKRCGLEMPYTSEMVEKNGAEGYDGCHPGFGQLIIK